MGYYVRRLPNKKSTPNWKIQIISHRKADFAGSPAKKPKKEWDLPRSHWRALGFHDHQSCAEAQARARQLNMKLKDASAAERRRQIELAQQIFTKNNRSHFPDIFCEEFESRYLGTHGTKTATKNRVAHWRAAQRLIININREPQDWYDFASEFFDYFCKHKYSVSYLRKVLRYVNLWGFFISRKLATPFMPIPNPRGYERARILDAYYSKGRKASRESDPITADQLNVVREKMRGDHYNWIAIAVWFGLRPHEIDQLKSKESYSIGRQPDRTTVLWVYQTKLISVAPWKRWKGIPVILEEQRRLLTVIEHGEFERPCGKTIKKYFGGDTRAYGGRKGFVDLMLRRGQSIENISQWLGHRSIERTWANYKDMRSFRYVAA